MRPRIEQDHAVGHGHRLDLVVGDVDHRDAELALQRPDLGAHLGAELRVEVGQAARPSGTPARAAMMARPSATRCCCPPESCEGLRARRPASPSRSATCASRASHSGLRAPCAPAARRGCSPRPTGAGTAHTTGRPSRSIAARAAAASRRARDADACRHRRASRPAIRRSVVDLPQPEGPSSTLSVPSSASKEMPSTRGPGLARWSSAWRRRQARWRTRGTSRGFQRQSWPPSTRRAGRGRPAAAPARRADDSKRRCRAREARTSVSRTARAAQPPGPARA